MDSFEELGLRPDLVEALIPEGIETPTALQAQAIPLLRRGNSAVLRAGPGAGATLAYGVALLDRLEPGARAPRALVLAPTRERASAVAESLGRPGLLTGHRCAALGGAWALPGHADVLAATPADAEAGIRSGQVKVSEVQALVIDGAGVILEPPEVQRVDRIREFLPGDEVQTILVGDPLTPTLRGWVESHLRKAVFLPPEAAGEAGTSAPVERGTLRIVAAGSGEEAARPVASVVARVLGEEVHHLLLYFRTEDRAADAADLLTVQGYAVGTPGDRDVPVWLGIDPLEERRRVEEAGIDRAEVVSVSVDVPPDADVLDRRHGGGRTAGVAIAAPRELPHLRRIATEAGYRLEELSLQGRAGESDEVAGFREEIQAALDGEDLGAYLTVLEPLFENRTAAEVAAAVTALLRRERRAGPRAETTARATETPTGPRPPAWTRLFLSVGSRDGVGPGDLLGAITGEAGLEGDQVGRIDIRDTFSRVEVEDAHANRVIQALNGTTMRGRSVRADFDRGEKRGGQEGRGPRPRGRRGRP